MSEATTVCANCGKSISATTFALHEVHCQRNYQRCACGELVNKAHLQTHLQTQHNTYTCPNCSQTMEKYRVEAHICEKPLRMCTYCEAQIRFDDYLEHVDMCGSRTQACPTCHGLITLREYEAHRAAGNCLPPLPSNPPIRQEQVVQWPRRPPGVVQGEAHFFSGPNVKGPYRIDDGEDRPVPVPQADTDPTEDMLLEQAIALSLAESSPVPSTLRPSSFDEEEDAALQQAIREIMQTH